MKSTLLIILSAIQLSLSAQIVSTVYSSNSNQITDAIIQDKHGNIYGSDFTGLRIYKISPTGALSIFTSGLNTPNGLAINSRGELYVADNLANRIYQYDSTGMQLDTILVNSPSGMIKELDSDTIIFTQFTGNALRKLAPDGTLSAPFASGAPLDGPVGLCYGADSLLYVGNFNDRRIYKLVNDSLIFVARVPGLSNTNLGFITQSNGYIYGTAFQTHHIYRVDPNYLDSTVLYSGSTAGNNNGSLSMARFNGPNGIYASRGGDSLLISDFNTGDIRMISGVITSLKKIEDVDFKIHYYPNPATDHLTVEVNESKDLELIIRDLRSREVVNRNKLIQGANSISIQGFTRGVYLLEFISQKGKKVEKLVVQ